MFGQMKAPPVSSGKQPRYGLMMARIDSNHVLRTPDGIERQYKVKNANRFPKANTVAICFFCKKQHATIEDLVADHPDEKVMRKQQERHVFALWSDDPLDGVKKEESKEKKEKPVIDYNKVVGLLSTEE